MGGSRATSFCVNVRESVANCNGGVRCAGKHEVVSRGALEQGLAERLIRHTTVVSLPASLHRGCAPIVAHCGVTKRTVALAAGIGAYPASDVQMGLRTLSCSVTVNNVGSWVHGRA